MKILYVVPNLKIGGIQRVTTLLSKEQSLHGHDVQILQLDPQKTLETSPGVTLHVLSKRQLFQHNPLWAIYWFLYKLLRNIASESEFFWAAPLYSRLFRDKLIALEQNGDFDVIFMRGIRTIRYLHTVPHKRCVYSLHSHLAWLRKTRGPLSTAYFSWLHRWVFNEKSILSVSRELKESFLDQAKIAATRTISHRVINNPCDLLMIRDSATESLDYTEPFIVSVGRLSKQKRHDILLRAFAMVETNCKLVLIGSGRQENNLKQLTAELGLEDRVLFTGMDPNPYRWIARAKVFVLSSDFEGFPNVLLEAVACCTPVISTRCEGAADILTGELAQGLVDIGDIDGMARTIEHYLSNPIKPTANDAERFSISNCAASYIEAAQNINYE